MNKKISSILFTALSLSVLPLITFAQIDVAGILGRVEGLFWQIFDGLVIIMVVYAGIKYLTAKGEPGKIAEANKALVWALIGVAVGILAQFSSGIISYFLFG